AFERELADELLVGKWTNLVAQSVTADDADLEALFRQRNEKTSIDYFVVSAAEQDVATTVDEVDIEQWYEEHPEDYTREAGRRIRLVKIERQAAPEGIEIAPNEIEAAYQANLARYSHGEQRRARHILFRAGADASDEQHQAARAQAAGVLDRLGAGEDFATLATELSEDTFSAQRGGDLDWFDRGDMVGPFDEAAFSMSPGDAPRLVETQFGYHVLEVTDRREAGARPIDEVRDEIVSELRLARAEELMAINARRIRDRMDSADDFATVAEEEGLEIASRFVNPREGLTDLRAPAEFRAAVLELEAGDISAPLRLPDALALVVVDELIPEGVAPLEEVRNRVSTDVLNFRAKEAAVSAAQNAADLYESLAEMAESLGKEVRESGELGPDQAIPTTGGGSAAVRAALFGEQTQVGDRGVVDVPAGALVFEITSRQPFDPTMFEIEKDALRTELVERKRLGMRRSLVDQLSQDLKIVVNDQLVERIDGGV
ncbi:MAG TPA: peptidyl-prolyl cis-trans isomerase, partial [Candidatus Polarisedimenticolaceae bacterium]|nr:peptidyl-prolyl cis-trans isomerase [Candidatus Polarisedimenticolaceae bacterium]